MNGISEANGVLTLDELTPELVAASMTSDKAPKGFYSGIILNHLASGLPYCIVTNDAWFNGREYEQNSVVQSVKNNIKTLASKAAKLQKQFPQCSVAKHGDDHVILVNVAAHLAKIAADAEAANSSDDDES